MANSGTQGMFKKNLYMMDSMTDDELDGKVRWFVEDAPST